MDTQRRTLPTYRYTSTRCYVANSYIGKSVHLLLGQTTYVVVSAFGDGGGGGGGGGGVGGGGGILL